MRTGWTAGFLAAASLATLACQNAQPSGPAFRPGTFSVKTQTILVPKNKVFPPKGMTLVPSVVVRQAGHVAASVRFDASAGCDLGLSLANRDSSEPSLHGAVGPGPLLTVAGDVPPGTYRLVLTPRGGKDQCKVAPGRDDSEPYKVTVSVP
jgi:hypothetical protein